MGRVTKGWPKLARYADDYSEDIQKRVKKIVVETAQLIVSNAKARAPVDEGELRDSISMEILNGGFSAVVHVGAEHAIWIEYGTGIYAVEGGGRQTPWSYYSDKLGRFVTTRGMRDQPFWHPALDIAHQYFVREMRRL